jgi:hypothetical protein
LQNSFVALWRVHRRQTQLHRPSTAAAARDHEISQSKLACSDWSAGDAFAYHYGDFNANAREAVKDAKYDLACSTRRGPVLSSSDAVSLPRIHVPNVNGEGFDQVLRSG